MSTKSRWWWKWVETREYAHGRATFFCGTVNEVTVSFPNFEQAYALAKAIEEQAKDTRYAARYSLLQEVGRIEP